MYKINGIDLKTAYGITPSQADGGNVAVVGFWDMPARIGKTEHDWGNDADGIEPYVLAEEIRFGGRDIKLTTLLRKSNENEALRACNLFYKDLSGLTSLAPLECIHGVVDVCVNGEIKTQYIGHGICKMVISFRQPIVDLTGIIPAATNSDLGIDGISFKDLGLTILSVDDRFNNPAPKAGQFIAYENEGFKITKKGTKEITVKAFINQPNYNAFKQCLSSLYALFSMDGTRYITYRNDALREFYVKYGFSLTNVNIGANGSMSAIITIKLTEVGAHLDWSFLTDEEGNELTDINGQKIIITP